MARGKDGEPISLDALLGELKKAREIVNGPGAIPEALSEEYFPNIPEQSLKVLKDIASNNREFDNSRVEIESIVGPIFWRSLDDERQSFLVVAHSVGMITKAVGVLRQEVEERIQRGLDSIEAHDRGAGFSIK
ncbi:MAG: hypothetical protein AAB656_03685 [Patescibacteria group bacterium]